MSAKSRRKRASPDDLYRSCKAGGDCIPDVQNKFENSTLADILLKIFGSVVYFGGLGIGSGKGSGGSLGYRPLGRPTTTREIPTTPIRPAVTVDPLGPTEIIPVDASTPSIVPLSEGTPDVDFVAPDAGPGLGADEIELYTITHPTTEGTNVGGNPTLIATDEGATAVLTVDPIVQPPPQVFFDPPAPSQYEFTVLQSNPITTTDINVFVDPSISGNTIGDFEEIPLQRLDFAEFEIEEPPQTSTPFEKLQKVTTRAKELYNKYTRQVVVRDPEFLSRPSRLVQFEIDNPAFDDDITIQFERDLAEVTAAPNEEFADVIKLGRARFSEVEGVVRVSRLGELGTITTRSGTTIGQRVHYYQDISTINDIETVELHTLGEHSGENVFVEAFLTSEIVDAVPSADIAISENDLLDTYDEDFNNAHLLFPITNEVEELSFIPSIPPGGTLKVFVPDYGDGLIVSYPNSYDPNIIVQLPDEMPITPAFYLDVYNDFNLHPSLLPPKKKRRRLDMF